MEEYERLYWNMVSKNKAAMAAKHSLPATAFCGACTECGGMPLWAPEFGERLQGEARVRWDAWLAAFVKEVEANVPKENEEVVAPDEAEEERGGREDDLDASHASDEVLSASDEAHTAAEEAFSGRETFVDWSADGDDADESGTMASPTADAWWEGSMEADGSAVHRVLEEEAEEGYDRGAEDVQRQVVGESPPAAKPTPGADASEEEEDGALDTDSPSTPPPASHDAASAPDGAPDTHSPVTPPPTPHGAASVPRPVLAPCAQCPMWAAELGRLVQQRADLEEQVHRRGAEVEHWRARLGEVLSERRALLVTQMEATRATCEYLSRPQLRIAAAAASARPPQDATLLTVRHTDHDRGTCDKCAALAQRVIEVQTRVDMLAFHAQVHEAALLRFRSGTYVSATRSELRNELQALRQTLRFLTESTAGSG